LASWPSLPPGPPARGSLGRKGLGDGRRSGLSDALVPGLPRALDRSIRAGPAQQSTRVPARASSLCRSRKSRLVRRPFRISQFVLLASAQGAVVGAAPGKAYRRLAYQAVGALLRPCASARLVALGSRHSTHRLRRSAANERLW